MQINAHIHAYKVFSLTRISTLSHYHQNIYILRHVFENIHLECYELKKYNTALCDIHPLSFFFQIYEEAYLSGFHADRNANGRMVMVLATNVLEIASCNEIAKNKKHQHGHRH